MLSHTIQSVGYALGNERFSIRELDHRLCDLRRAEREFEVVMQMLFEMEETQ